MTKLEVTKEASHQVLSVWSGLNLSPSCLLDWLDHQVPIRCAGALRKARGERRFASNAAQHGLANWAMPVRPKDSRAQTRWRQAGRSVRPNLSKPCRSHGLAGHTTCRASARFSPAYQRGQELEIRRRWSRQRKPCPAAGARRVGGRGGQRCCPTDSRCHDFPSQWQPSGAMANPPAAGRVPSMPKSLPLFPLLSEDPAG
jgi:hypothetical protein